MIAACAPKTPNQTPAHSEAQDPTVTRSVIYGDDNRHDYFAETDLAIREAADSTVALMNESSLTPGPMGKVVIKGEPYGKTYGLCETEAFWEQETAAFCSGFLVASDVIVTAGHCITKASECASTAIIFDFAYKAPGLAPKTVPENNVYRCKNIIHTESSSAGADFAVIKLDRAVTDRRPVGLRRQGSPKVGDDIFVAGHPTGLPLKIAGGAKIRSTSPQAYFIANLDTYGGNSGSAVFNARTLEVEGVLVRGEQDFKWGPGRCMTSNVCPSTGCRGEDVTKISETLSYLPALTKTLY
jgi:S1-C subfamily serine protease